MNCSVTIELQLWFIILTDAHTHHRLFYCCRRCYCYCSLPFLYLNCNKSFNHSQGSAFARKKHNKLCKQTKQRESVFNFSCCCFFQNQLCVFNEFYFIQSTWKILWTNVYWVVRARFIRNNLWDMVFLKCDKVCKYRYKCDRNDHHLFNCRHFSFLLPSNELFCVLYCANKKKQ